MIRGLKKADSSATNPSAKKIMIYRPDRSRLDCAKKPSLYDDRGQRLLVMEDVTNDHSIIVLRSDQKTLDKQKNKFIYIYIS